MNDAYYSGRPLCIGEVGAGAYSESQRLRRPPMQCGEVGANAVWKGRGQTYVSAQSAKAARFVF